MEFNYYPNVACIPEIAAVRPRARDNIMTCDIAGFAREYRVVDRIFAGWGADHVRKMESGDNSLVQLSDQFLSALEDEMIVSRSWANTADVVGALPIVPAYIAGVPQNMRQRRRVRAACGPLSVFLECTGSAGSMGINEAQQRGAAMLALVRALAPLRPVELWLCVTFGHHDEMNGLLCKIETQPLDLARAAHMLCGLSATASVGAALISAKIGHHCGSWSYGVPELERKWCGEIFKRFLQPGSDVLYVPAAYARDQNVANPSAWVRDMLRKYGGETVQEREEAA